MDNYTKLANCLRDLPHLLFVQLHGHEDIVYEAADAIDELKNYKNWISVKERLPEGFAAVIVARHIKKGEPLKVEQGYYLGNGFWKVYGTQTKRVLFWMPFPEPPEEKDADADD